MPTHVRSLADSAGDAERWLTSSKEHLVASLAELMDYLYQSSDALDVPRWIGQSGGNGGGVWGAGYPARLDMNQTVFFFGGGGSEEQGLMAMRKADLHPRPSPQNK